MHTFDLIAGFMLYFSIKRSFVTRDEKIGLMCTQNLTTFLDFKLE